MLIAVRFCVNTRETTGALSDALSVCSPAPGGTLSNPQNLMCWMLRLAECARGS